MNDVVTIWFVEASLDGKVELLFISPNGWKCHQYIMNKVGDNLKQRLGYYVDATTNREFTVWGRYTK